MAFEALKDRREITSQDIERHGVPWCMTDEVAENIRNKPVLIVNTDLSGGPGIHWLCLFVRDNEVEIFDPLGPENKRSNWDILLEEIRSSGMGVHIMPIRAQAKKSSHCGWFSLAAARLGPDALALVFADVNKAKSASRTALGNVKQLIRMFGYQE